MTLSRWTGAGHWTRFWHEYPRKIGETAAIQLRSGIDIDANIDDACDLIRQAALVRGAEFIATPEMTHLVQRSPKRLFAAITDQDNDCGVIAFQALSAELGVTLLIGSLAIKTAQARAVNRSFLFGPDGALIGTYDKIHLFDVTVSKTETWKESNVYDAGDRSALYNIGQTTLGLSVCYDLRFPHLYRHYAKNGAEILAVPSAFTKPTGAAHWQPLLRARAIETGSFVIAPAQGGSHADGRATYGHSMIIGPWGDILAHLDHDQPGFCIADIDLAAVTDARRRIPAWSLDTDFHL